MNNTNKQGFFELEEICRPGRKFIFQIGIDRERLDGLMRRVKEAYIRFASMPLVSDVAKSLELERMTLVSFIYGTNTIEGGTLSEEEIERVLTTSTVGLTVGEQEKRVLNLKNAYEEAERFLLAGPDLASAITKTFFGHEPRKIDKNKEFTAEIIKKLNHLVMEGLVNDPDKPVGVYRFGERSSVRVGNYQPPICHEDIVKLMQAFLDWLASPALRELPGLYVAPLVHYYFESIHPFWDGNGRVGRILEAMSLRMSADLSMENYVPYAIWHYYLEHIDKYFELFSHCRKLAKEGNPYPNTPFVEFFLNGMLATINRLHDKANIITGSILFEHHIHTFLVEKKINERQHAILMELRKIGSCSRSILNNIPWYNALYHRLTKQTKSRDLRELQNLKLIFIAPYEDIIQICGFNPSIQLDSHIDTQPY